MYCTFGMNRRLLKTLRQIAPERQIKDKKVSMGFGVVFGVLSRSDMQSAVMHEKTIARSHSVLMHVCMAEDFIQLSIKRPTDIGAGCALLAGRQQPVAWFETGFGFLARFWV